MRDKRIIARFGAYFIRADMVREGDLLDLQNDPYADPDGWVTGGRKSSSIFQFEFARVIEPPVRETAACVLIHTDQGSFGFPPDHELETTLDAKDGSLVP